MSFGEATDGDNDLGRYAAELFPGALHTVDGAHVVEKLWDVGSSLHREGSSEHHAWVSRPRRRSSMRGPATARGHDLPLLGLRVCEPICLTDARGQPPMSHRRLHMPV